MKGIRINRDDRDAIAKKMNEAAASALEDAANEMLRAANQTVPAEEHVLEGSGEVSVDAATLTAQISYGGAASSYAVQQHEETGWIHDGGRRAKWLELAFRENGSRVGDWLAKAIKAAF